MPDSLDRPFANNHIAFHHGDHRDTAIRLTEGSSGNLARDH